MKKTLSLILALIMTAVLFCGCAETDKDNKSSSITVTDMAGRKVTLSEPATRVVALMPADCETLFAIGAGDCLVGRGEYCNYPAAVNDIPAVQSGSETNIEQIIALAPQLVIMSKMAQTVEQNDALTNAGIQVFVSDAQTIEEIYTSIELIGKLVGKQSESEKVISDMRSSFDQVKAKAQSGEKSIYFEVSPLEYGLWSAGKKTFMQEIADMLGVKNIFDDIEGWAAVSAEQVIARNPDYIVTTSGYYGTGPLPTDEILGRSGWGGINAIASGKVFNADSDLLTIPSVRLADGAKSLCDFIYGE